MTTNSLPWSDADLAEGRRCVADLDRAQWTLGDLTVRIAGPPPQRGQHDPNGVELRAFADAISISPRRLADYRTTAHTWPTATRMASASWTLHRHLAGRDELARFLDHCTATQVAPTRARLRVFLAPERNDGTITVPRTWEDAADESARLDAEVKERVERDLLLPIAAELEAEGVDVSDGAAVLAAVETQVSPENFDRTRGVLAQLAEEDPDDFAAGGWEDLLRWDLAHGEVAS